MSKFECPLVRVEIEPHPNADQIEIAKVGGYRSIVRKGQFRDGQFAVYIPEAAIVPGWMLDAMGLRDKLSGPAKNRVKAIKLRGTLSQGLLYPVDQVGTEGSYVHFVSGPPDEYGHSQMVICEEGNDLSNLLGITKYEPTIPVHMAGKVAGYDPLAALKYDFDSIQKMMDMFEDGEEVVMTEKIHGTFCMIGVIPEALVGDALKERYKVIEVDGHVFYGVVSSKGLGAKGLMLDVSDVDNLYVRHAMPIWEELARQFSWEMLDQPWSPVFLLGEIYGADVQDLTYGMSPGQTGFVAFDLVDMNEFLPLHGWSGFNAACANMGVRTVPELYVGPFRHDLLRSYTDLPSRLAAENGANQLSEGVVVRPVRERDDYRGNRAIAKSVSEKYLLRRNATEYN